MRARFSPQLGAVAASVLAVTGAAAAPAAYIPLHDFARPEGARPNSGVVADAHGNIYGTLALGGPSRAGEIWRLDPQGHLAVLYAFRGAPDGRIPDSAPILDAAGALYGTVAFGGAHNLGAVWRLSPPAHGAGRWTETLVHSFAGGSGDGANPQARLLAGPDGTLYGTAVFGGPANKGVVFALTPGQNGYTETILHGFAGGTSDGALPVAGLLADGAGGFYGTTIQGGVGAQGGNGTVFHLAPSGQGYVETILHFFAGAPADGAQSFSQLVADGAGTLYGTTSVGGSHDAGTAFSLTPAGEERVIADFGGLRGRQPFCGLVFDGAGDLWGTTYRGGTTGAGTVFELSPPAQGTTLWPARVVWNFEGPPGDGAHPYATFSPGAHDTLIGTTFLGGAENRGTVFEMQLLSGGRARP